VDSICFGKSRIHVGQCSRDVAFATPDFGIGPDDPCTCTSAIGMDNCIAHKMNACCGEESSLEHVGMGMWLNIMPEQLGPCLR